MDTVVMIIGLWFIISIPASLLVARFLSLNSAPAPVPVRVERRTIEETHPTRPFRVMTSA